jgi:hypothetical protein
MDFLEKNNFPQNTSIMLERGKLEDGRTFYSVKTKNGEPVGIGYYNPDINEDNYFFSGIYFLKEILTELWEEVEKNDGRVFVIADNHCYCCNLVAFRLVSEKKTNSKEFEEEFQILLEVAAKKKDDERLKKEELLLSKIENLEKALSEKIDQLKASENEVEQLKRVVERNKVISEENETRLKKFETEYVKDKIKLTQLKKIYSKEQIALLTRKPFYYDETEFNISNRIGGQIYLNKKRENEVLEMYLIKSEDLSFMKLKVLYSHRRNTGSGGDGVPGNLDYFEEKEHYFTIDSNEVLKKSVPRQSDSDRFTLIVF